MIEVIGVGVVLVAMDARRLEIYDVGAEQF